MLDINKPNNIGRSQHEDCLCEPRKKRGVHRSTIAENCLRQRRISDYEPVKDDLHRITKHRETPSHTFVCILELGVTLQN